MKKTLLSISILFFSVGLFAQDLISSTFIRSYSQLEIEQDFGLATFLTHSGVDCYKVTYTTANIAGESSVASGLVVIPQAPAIYPQLCYQHGTVGSREQVPSNIQGDPLAIAYGAMGYVASAADFLGLGDSPGPHPYVHAATEASAAIDLLRAVQELMEQDDQPSQLNEQLFVAGYSQGGHAAAAVHRELQENLSDEFTVTASTPMSGPYSISGAMRDLILDDSEYFSTSYIPNTMLSYNAVYDIYDSTEDFFKPEYAAKIDLFAAEEITLWELEVELQTLLFANEGGSYPKRMIQDTLVAAIESNPNHPVNLALEDNDVYDWTPQAPTRLYYCMADDQVPFMNSLIAQEAMIANGAPDLEAIDLNSDFTHTQCVSPAITNSIFFFNQFRDIDDLPPSAVNNTNLLENVSIQPNPASAFLTVDWDSENNDTGWLEIYDIAGKKLNRVAVSANTENRIDIENLNAGMYWMVVLSEGRRSVEAITVK